jgi:hypothetical protein
MKKTSALRRIALATMVTGTTMLGGCALVDQAKPGTPLAQVIQQFGKPSTECPRPDGTSHLVWTQQPLAETAMGTTVDKNGKIGKVVQLLTDASFNRLGQGTWTQQDVLCEFGPPVREEEIGFAEKRSYVWSYRYMQWGVWYSLMYVYFDLNTKTVTHFNAGPDPLHTLNR